MTWQWRHGLKFVHWEGRRCQYDHFGMLIVLVRRLVMISWPYSLPLVIWRHQTEEALKASCWNESCGCETPCLVSPCIACYRYEKMGTQTKLLNHKLSIIKDLLLVKHHRHAPSGLPAIPSFSLVGWGWPSTLPGCPEAGGWSLLLIDSHWTLADQMPMISWS